MEQKLSLKNPEIPTLIHTLVCFNPDEHRIGIRSCNHYCTMHVKDPRLAVILTKLLVYSRDTRHPLGY